MRDAAIGGRQDRNPLQIFLAAAEQLVGQALVHAVTSEEQALRLLAFLGAAVLEKDRLQILDLRHEERTFETFHHPAGQPYMIGMRVGDDQPRNPDMGQRSVEQRAPGRDRFLIAETGVNHRPAIAIGEQIDVYVIETERQLQADPQNSRHHLHDLIGAGMIFPGVTQCLCRGPSCFCF